MSSIPALEHDEQHGKRDGLQAVTAVDWRRLFRYVQPYRRRLVVAIICLFVSVYLA